MSVQCILNFSLEDLRKSRIDFTPGGKVVLGDTVPSHCKVLQSDKILYGDKSTTGSPISSNRGSSLPQESSGSSSESCAASPISYTQDLIGVDSPGLSGGAGGLTPSQEQLSPLVPLTKYPSSATGRNDNNEDRNSFPVRRTLEDSLSSKSNNGEKSSNGKASHTNGTSNGKRKAEAELSSEDSDSDGEDEAYDTRLFRGIGPYLKRAKTETPVSSHHISSSSQNVSSRPPSSRPSKSSPLIGPVLPPSLNGSSRQWQSEGPSSSPTVSSSMGTASSTRVNTLSNGLSNGGRKRLLSERGEKELTYPVMEKDNKWDWAGANWTGGRPRGAGLINRANDCFLNVILQMVTHTAPLARYLVERHEAECKREKSCVACSIRDEHLMRTFNRPGPLDTRWIRQHLARIFPSHCFGMQEDAHELFALLLDAIDPPPSSDSRQFPMKKLKASTPIEQIFGGTLRNQLTCQSCQTPHINYERIRELNVAITMRRNEGDGDRVTLDALINNYFKNETLQSFACKKCARKTQAVRCTRILRSPAVLLVQLKRFNAYGGKIKQAVFPDRELNVSRFSFDVDTEKKEKCSEYMLTGVVEHLGSTVDHGHYIAYVKGTDNQSWWKFDDDEVSKCNVASANPYLLVYSRKDLRRASYPAANNGMSNGNGVKKMNGPSQSTLYGKAAPSNGVSKLVHNNNNPYKLNNYYGNTNQYNGNGGRPPMKQYTFKSSQHI